MAETTLDGGTIRRLYPGENWRYRDHLLRLDADSRRNRFGGTVGDTFIRELAISTASQGALLYGFFAEDVLRGVAELRMLSPAEPPSAEVAFSIERAWQGQGIGTALLEHVLLAARNRRVTILRMSCLPSNEPMRQLARKFEAALRFEYGSVAGEVQSARPTPLSLMREAVTESFGVAHAVIDAQARLLTRSRG